MRGTKRENAKNFLLSLLLGIVAAKCFVFQKSSDAWIVGYLIAQLAWVVLMTYDEILRKRRESRKRK